jgi:WD40 repeat protein
VSGSGDNTAKVWDLRTGGNCISTIATHQNKVRNVCLVENLLVTGSGISLAFILLTLISFVPYAKMLSSDDATVKLLDTRKLPANKGPVQLVDSFTFDRIVNDICFDGLRLIIALANSEVCLYLSPSPTLLSPL